MDCNIKKSDLAKHLFYSIYVLTLLACACVSQPSLGSENIAIISPTNTSLYTEAILGISDNLNSHIQIDTYFQDKLTTDEILAKLQSPRFIITVGTNSTLDFLGVNSLLDISMISILLPSTIIDAKNNSAWDRITGMIFIDQSHQRKIDTLKIILPTAQVIGMITSNPDRAEIKDIISSSRSNDLQIIHKQINNESELTEAVDTISNQSDAMLAIADPLVYNARSIKRIIINTYRNNVPIFGYSNAITKAGALASIYTPPYYIGKEVAEVINHSLTRSILPEKFFKHPKYYKIAINTQVANSLGIKLNKDFLNDVVRQDQ